jgi:hypothetical protein
MKTKPHLVYARGLWWCFPCRGAGICYMGATPASAYGSLVYERGYPL